jgi:hypothetical protein
MNDHEQPPAALTLTRERVLEQLGNLVASLKARSTPIGLGPHRRAVEVRTASGWHRAGLGGAPRVRPVAGHRRWQKRVARQLASMLQFRRTTPRGLPRSSRRSRPESFGRREIEDAARRY